MIARIVRVLAAGVAVFTLGYLLIGCAGGDKAQDGSIPANLLRMSTVPSFLMQQPEKVDKSAFGAVVIYDPAAPSDPRVTLNQFTVPVTPATKPRNPIEWVISVDRPDRLLYYSVFECGQLTVDASVAWDSAPSRDIVAAQLTTVKDELDERCREF